MMDFEPLEAELPLDLRAFWEALLEQFRQMDSAVVAFSGGVDSGLLCAAAYRALGTRMLALTISSPVESLGDAAAARHLAEQVGFPWRIVDYDDLIHPQFVQNPPDRCYYCKLERFKTLIQIASSEGYAAVVEGSNADDTQDYRPGWKAVQQTGVRSPLMDLGINKKTIRDLSQALGLTVWNRPSAPCLATRFPYGSPITARGLRQVAEGEQFLTSLGFTSVRVRHHDTVARLEVAPGELERLLNCRQKITAFFKQLGFNYTALDLEGYRSGSLNESIK